MSGYSSPVGASALGASLGYPGGESSAHGNVLSSLKTQLVNTSAELLIVKSRYDEKCRDFDKLSKQFVELQAKYDVAEVNARSALSNEERVAALQSDLARTQSELRGAQDRVDELFAALDNEKSENVANRAQIAHLEKELEATRKIAESTSRDIADTAAAIRAELNDCRAREAALSRDKEELQLKLELAVRSLRESEESADLFRREADEQKERTLETMRDSECSQSSMAAQIASLQKARNELSSQLTAEQSVVADLKQKLESAVAAKAQADAEIVRLQTSLDAAKQERERISTKWQQAESKSAAEAAASIALRAQLTEAQTSLQLLRSKSDSAAAVATAQASVKGLASPGGTLRSENLDDTLSATYEAETVLVGSLKRQVRQLESEREAISDILASFVPLPSFVRERAAEAESTLLAHGASRSAASKNIFSDETEEALEAFADSPIITQLKNVALERPLVIDALTYLDIQMRALRVDKERLSATLDATKAAEQSTEATLAGLRRQLAVCRQEVAAVTEARDAAQDKCNKLDTELRARVSELATVRTQFSAESSKNEKLVRDLDETKNQVAILKDEVETLTARLETQRVDYEAQISLEKSARESAAQFAAAAAEEERASHTQQVQSLFSRLGETEAALDTARHELEILRQRVLDLERDLEKSKANASGLQATVHSMELALAQAEGHAREAMEARREADSHRIRAVQNLEEVIAQRDELVAKEAAYAGEIALFRGRIAELQTLEEERIQAEAKIAALEARSADLESALAQSQAESDALEQRLHNMKETHKSELERAQSATERVMAELQSQMNARKEDAEQSASLAGSSRRSIAQLQTEIENQKREINTYKERCKTLQNQVSNLAAEVQEKREQMRKYHDEAIQAKADSKAEAEKSQALHKATLEQLETIKSDFFSFLSMFNQDSDLSSSISLRSPSKASTTSLINTISSDISELKQRLDALVEGAASRANFTGLSAASPRPSPALQSPSSYMSRTLHGVTRTGEDSYSVRTNLFSPN